MAMKSVKSFEICPKKSCGTCQRKMAVNDNLAFQFLTWNANTFYMEQKKQTLKEYLVSLLVLAEDCLSFVFFIFICLNYWVVIFVSRLSHIPQITSYLGYFVVIFCICKIKWKLLHSTVWTNFECEYSNTTWVPEHTIPAENCTLGLHCRDGVNYIGK